MEDRDPASVARRATLALALAALAVSPGFSRARSEPRLDLAVIRPVLDEALEASGVGEPVERAAFAARFDALAEALAQKIGPGTSPAHKAKKLHRLLHREIFRQYRSEADGLPAVLDHGEYNCVSASMIEALLGRALGLDTWLVAGPRHVFLRVELPAGRSVDIEATAPDGFDARRGARSAGRLLLAYKIATPDEIAARGARAVVDAYEGIGAPVPLEHAPAFVWHNAGQRALLRMDALGAARCFRSAQLRHPDVATPLDASEIAVARAFRIAYDEARFEDAYRIAVIGVDLAPGHVSARDRLVAAAVQRIELAADAGNPALAESVLTEVRGLTQDGAAGFERRAIPGIVGATVRVGDWACAERLSRRYAEVETDPVEVARLLRWVALRAQIAPGSRLP